MDLISAEKLIRLESVKINSTQVWDRLLYDKRLSKPARLVHIMLKNLSERPGWKVTLTGLATIMDMERRQVSRFTKELKDLGYLDSERFQDDKGKWVGWIWTIYPIPKKELAKLNK